MSVQDIILKQGKHYVTVSQLARLLGVTRQNINYHISKGHIRALRIQMSPVCFYRLIPMEQIEKAKAFVTRLK